MSVLIKGMEMPTEEYGSMTITIYPNGSVMEYIGDIGRSLGYAVPVPPHGALIDRDDFLAECSELVNGYKAITDDFVVIPAEEAAQKDGGQNEAPSGPYDLLYEEGGYNSNGV